MWLLLLLACGEPEQVEPPPPTEPWRSEVLGIAPEVLDAADGLRTSVGRAAQDSEKVCLAVDQVLQTRAALETALAPLDPSDEATHRPLDALDARLPAILVDREAQPVQVRVDWTELAMAAGRNPEASAIVTAGALELDLRKRGAGCVDFGKSGHWAIRLPAGWPSAGECTQNLLRPGVEHWLDSLDHHCYCGEREAVKTAATQLYKHVVRAKDFDAERRRDALLAHLDDPDVQFETCGGAE